MSESSSAKRKIKDDTAEEIARPRKRARLTDIILGEEDDRSDTALDERVRRRREKLLEAVRLRRRYGYHCTQHNVSFHLEENRRKKKANARRARDGLLTSFRELKVDAEEELEVGRSATENTAPESGVQCDNDSVNTFKKPVSCRGCKRKISPDRNEEEPRALGVKKPRSQARTYDLFDSEEDSDYDTDSQCAKCYRRNNYKVMLVKRVDGSEFPEFTEQENCKLSEPDGPCDCDHHEKLSEKFHVWNESSDSSGCEGDGDPFPTSWYGSKFAYNRC